MQKKQRIILLLVVGCITTVAIGCEKNARIEGKVLNQATGDPVAGVPVLATTKTSIKEEQPWAEIETKTNENGTYVIETKLTDTRYRIDISDTKEDNWASAVTSAKSPKQTGQTRMVDATEVDPYKKVSFNVVSFLGEDPVDGCSVREKHSERKAKETEQPGEYQIVVPPGMLALTLECPDYSTRSKQLTFSSTAKDSGEVLGDTWILGGPNRVEVIQPQALDDRGTPFWLYLSSSEELVRAGPLVQLPEKFSPGWELLDRKRQRSRALRNKAAVARLLPSDGFPGLVVSRPDFSSAPSISGKTAHLVADFKPYAFKLKKKHGLSVDPECRRRERYHYDDVLDRSYLLDYRVKLGKRVKLCPTCPSSNPNCAKYLNRVDSTQIKEFDGAANISKWKLDLPSGGLYCVTGKKFLNVKKMGKGINVPWKCEPCSCFTFVAE